MRSSPAGRGPKTTTPEFLPKAIELAIYMNTLSVNAKSEEPSFVVVHAKIARGAFTHWLIKNRVQSFQDLFNFGEIGYKYNKKLSTLAEPVFVAKEFGGLGLSVRLS